MSSSDLLSRLYDDHAQAIFALLLNLTRNESDTRDVLQELFVRIARRPELLAAVQNERAFMLRLATNAAIDLSRRHHARDRKHERLAAECNHAFAKTADPDEQSFRQALDHSVAALPFEQRIVVHLKLWEGLTFEAIAELLAIPLNTAASRYRYGLDKLREQLRPLYEEIRQ